jgi:4-amino-4-deoxy-L-arabinose transferase-like glycosyltransferase
MHQATDDSPLPAAQSAWAEQTGPRDSKLHLWILLALTVLSGFLCFNRLSYPPLLIDEAFTYWRTCGNLDQLLDSLRNDAFVPLHYELLVWIHEGFPLGFGVRLVPGGIYLTPTVLRFFPAMCGCAMTPVMYFLARQMFDRRTALVAAAFIGCSAFGLYFSRNAKMYAPVWMFSTLSVACFFWWIRTWVRLAWLCWICAGIAAAGYQAVSLLLLPLAPLYFLSMGKFGWRRVTMLVVGMALIAVGPAIYYARFNQWTQNSGGLVPGVVGKPNSDAKWENSGLNWIFAPPNSVTLPFNALNNFLFGYDKWDLEELSNWPPLLEKYGSALFAAVMTVYGVLIFGLLPWRRRTSVLSGDPAVQPWWRSLFWVGAWLVLPVYGVFYCRSVDPIYSPMDWLRALATYAGPYWPAWVMGSLVLAIAFSRLRSFAVFLAIVGLLVAAAAVVQTARDKLDWMGWIWSPWARGAIVLLVPALLIHFCGVSVFDRGMELLRFIAVVGVILVLCGLMCLGWRYLRDVSMRRSPDLPWQSIWDVRYVAIVWPAVWLAAAALVCRLPTKIFRAAAVLLTCGLNVANALGREYVPTSMPFDQIFADVYSAQPHSGLRTYTDLKMIYNNFFARPQAAYYSCLTARLDPSPKEFRSGFTWPFRYGTIEDVFKSRCIYTPYISPEAMDRDLDAHREVGRVIIWDLLPDTDEWWRHPPAEAPPGDKWKLESEKEIRTHWYWDWHDQWGIFRRRVFVKMN